MEYNGQLECWHWPAVPHIIVDYRELALACGAAYNSQLERWHWPAVSRIREQIGALALACGVAYRSADWGVLWHWPVALHISIKKSQHVKICDNMENTYATKKFKNTMCVCVR